MLDSDFKIERPKRYYRQGLNLLHLTDDEDDGKSSRKRKDHHPMHTRDGRLLMPDNLDAVSHARSHSTIGTVRSTISRILHMGRGKRDGHDSDGDSSSSSSSDMPSRPPTPMLDPSTNTNPLAAPDEQADGETDGKPNHPSHRTNKDKQVSKHTFYIENSQMRLKLFARSEVSPIPVDG